MKEKNEAMLHEHFAKHQVPVLQRAPSSRKLARTTTLTTSSGRPS